ETKPPSGSAPTPPEGNTLLRSDDDIREQERGQAGAVVRPTQGPADRSDPHRLPSVGVPNGSAQRPPSSSHPPGIGGPGGRRPPAPGTGEAATGLRPLRRRVDGAILARVGRRPPADPGDLPVLLQVRRLCAADPPERRPGQREQAQSGTPRRADDGRGRG